MKKTKFMVLFLNMALIFGNCGSMNNIAKGGVIGGGSGAASGVIIGGIAGKGEGVAIGAVVGTVVGVGAGMLIGRKMDKKAAEAAKTKDAQVEQVTDNNGLAAVKVTSPSGILFALNSSVLSAVSRQSLAEFISILKEDPTVDVAITGHTDKVGTYEANQKVPFSRAYAVENYLQSCDARLYQFKEVEGAGYSQYNEVETSEQNRHVEIFMYTSE